MRNRAALQFSCLVLLLVQPVATTWAETQRDGVPLLSCSDRPSSDLASPADRAVPVSDRMVLAHHYPWYGYKEPRNWDEQKALVDHPLLGPYRSADPALIDFQVTLAQDAGIDGFVVSWSSADSPAGKIFDTMLDQLLKSPNRRFQLCVLFEALANTPNISDEKLQHILGLIIKKYGNHSAYLRASGKPVIFVYGPQHKSIDRWRAIRESLTKEIGPAFYVAVPDGWDIDLDYFSAFDGIGPYADKYYKDSVLVHNYERTAKRARGAGLPVIVTAIGGGGRYQKLGFDIDRTKGQYLSRQFGIATDLKADWVVLTSWNEWYEGNQVEPSREYEFEQVTYLRESTAAFKGAAPPSLKGAALSAEWSGDSETAAVSVRNTGKVNVYCIAADADRGIRLPVASMLRPAESVKVSLPRRGSKVVGFLIDNTTVRATLP